MDDVDSSDYPYLQGGNDDGAYVCDPGFRLCKQDHPEVTDYDCCDVETEICKHPTYECVECGATQTTCIDECCDEDETCCGETCLSESDNDFVKCCAGELYWPEQNQECCDDTIYNPEIEGCCNGEPYNLEHSTCCEDESTGEDGPCCDDEPLEEHQSCCEGEPYDTRLSSCCGGEIIAADMECCDGKEYNPNRSLCCEGKIRDYFYGEGEKCCGDKIYYPPKETCCGVSYEQQQWPDYDGTWLCNNPQFCGNKPGACEYNLCGPKKEPVIEGEKCCVFQWGAIKEDHGPYPDDYECCGTTACPPTDSCREEIRGSLYRCASPQQA